MSGGRGARVADCCAQLSRGPSASVNPSFEDCHSALNPALASKTRRLSEAQTTVRSLFCRQLAKYPRLMRCIANLPTKRCRPFGSHDSCFTPLASTLPVAWTMKRQNRPPWFTWAPGFETAFKTACGSALRSSFSGWVNRNLLLVFTLALKLHHTVNR